MKEDLRKKLIKIAHHYGVRCNFSKRVSVPYVDERGNKIFMGEINPSDFFHELGHILDYRNGIFRDYYRIVPTKKAIRRQALRAELHADSTGRKLMKQYFPKMRFVDTYKYKKWQRFLKKHWGVE